jgi:hypothetical protein
MGLTDDQIRAYFAELEEVGPSQVRSDLDRGKISPALYHHVSKWLADKEREAELRSSAAREREASAAERAADAAERASAAAERQAEAAERANKTAKTALTIAIISIVITVIGMVIVHFDTIRH